MTNYFDKAKTEQPKAILNAKEFDEKMRKIKAKEKAKELFEQFSLGGWPKEHSIRCVNEICDAIDWHEFDKPNKE